jgi:hypothetical protein
MAIKTTIPPKSAQARQDDNLLSAGFDILAFPFTPTVPGFVPDAALPSLNIAEHARAPPENEGHCAPQQVTQLSENGGRGNRHATADFQLA